MSEVVDLKKARLEKKIKGSFKNWAGQLEGCFGASTRLEDIPDKTLEYLAGDRESTSFYFFDFIMTLKDLGSGFMFNELEAADKLTVIDIHLFLLDRIRYEYMKRLGWLVSYPGEEQTLTELVLDFNELAPDIQARPASLSENHPDYQEYCSVNLFEKEQIIRRLIPEAVNKIL